jgi:hypothetical protein
VSQLQLQICGSLEVRIGILQWKPGLYTTASAVGHGDRQPLQTSTFSVLRGASAGPYVDAVMFALEHPAADLLTGVDGPLRGSADRAAMYGLRRSCSAASQRGHQRLQGGGRLCVERQIRFGGGDRVDGHAGGVGGLCEGELGATARSEQPLAECGLR